LQRATLAREADLEDYVNADVSILNIIRSSLQALRGLCQAS
jgi:hypothetical protein